MARMVMEIENTDKKWHIYVCTKTKEIDPNFIPSSYASIHTISMRHISLFGKVLTFLFDDVCLPIFFLFCFLSLMDWEYTFFVLFFLALQVLESTPLVIIFCQSIYKCVSLFYLFFSVILWRRVKVSKLLKIYFFPIWFEPKKKWMNDYWRRKNHLLRILANYLFHQL